jgi:hypothetical protein
VGADGRATAFAQLKDYAEAAKHPPYMGNDRGEHPKIAEL